MQIAQACEALSVNLQGTGKKTKPVKVQASCCSVYHV